MSQNRLGNESGPHLAKAEYAETFILTWRGQSVGPPEGLYAADQTAARHRVDSGRSKS